MKLIIYYKLDSNQMYTKMSGLQRLKIKAPHKVLTREGGTTVEMDEQL